MKRIFSACFLCCLLFPLQARQAYTPDNLPKVHLQNKYRYVCDPEDILQPAATDSIDRMLYRLEGQTGIETVVAVVPGIGDADCFDFCHRLLNSWGVGKNGKDNGLVILLVIDQRCIQFYTGYGLEGILPDAICKRIQTQAMIPYLKDGQWSEGMVAGVRAVCGVLDGSMKNDAVVGGQAGWQAFIVGIIIFCSIAFCIVYLVWKRNKCPQCGKRKLQRAGSRLVSIRDGVKTEDVIYICQHCGHVVTRRERNGGSNRGSGGGWGGPIIFGGGFGGFGGSGGFSGGSFGGGSGGGGGAGSRF